LVYQIVFIRNIYILYALIIVNVFLFLTDKNITVPPQIHEDTKAYPIQRHDRCRPQVAAGRQLRILDWRASLQWQAWPNL